MGKPMMARERLKSLTVMACVATITLPFLAACSGVSEEEDTQNINALEARGFKDPVLVREAVSGPWYDVTVGNCRLTIHRTPTSWEMPVDGDKPGTLSPGQLDVATIEAQADTIGLTHCFGS